MIRDGEKLLERLRAIHEIIRDRVIAACEEQAIEQLSRVVAEDEAGDTIFAIDRISEAVLLDHFAELARDWSFVLIAEGLGTTGRTVLPEGTNAADAELVIIVDPIDGTRGLMYQKRPAWILTGVAPNRGESTNLADIEIAVQTEIPLIKQHLCDTLWALKDPNGQPKAEAERYNRLSGQRRPLALSPSKTPTIEQGYGGISRFFPGGRDLLAAIEEAVIERVLGAPPPGRALAFEDQYVCSGGQLYELMLGHDRWQADLRPLIGQKRATPHLCCHPYDLCTELIARACGVIVTNEYGAPQTAPLTVEHNVGWVGYANRHIQAQIEPALQAVLREFELWQM
jgi:hypothetical protein